LDSPAPSWQGGRLSLLTGASEAPLQGLSQSARLTSTVRIELDRNRKQGVLSWRRVRRALRRSDAGEPSKFLLQAPLRSPESTATLTANPERQRPERARRLVTADPCP
jgi:hypothetical protein